MSTNVKEAVAQGEVVPGGEIEKVCRVYHGRRLWGFYRQFKRELSGREQMEELLERVDPR